MDLSALPGLRDLTNLPQLHRTLITLYRFSFLWFDIFTGFGLRRHVPIKRVPLWIFVLFGIVCAVELVSWVRVTDSGSIKVGLGHGFIYSNERGLLTLRTMASGLIVKYF